MNNKTIIKNIFILVLGVFVIIPIIYTLFGLNINTPVPYEGYTNYTNFSDKNKNINRVDISGIDISYGSSGSNKYTGKSGEYLYCPAGNIVCPSNQDVSLVGTFDFPTGGKGNTYAYKCINVSGGTIPDSDLSHVSCEDNLLSSDSINSLYFISESDKDNNGNYKSQTYKEVTSASGKGLTGTGLDGFTDPYKFIPMSISGEYVYLYKSDSINPYFKTSPCFLYETSLDCKTNYLDFSSSDTSDTSDDSSTCASGEGMKCLANNGAKVGDPLCCGQTGVVQNTKYNCPSEYPTCVGYKCGQSWGKCTK